MTKKPGRSCRCWKGMRSCRGQRRRGSGTKRILSLFPGPAAGSGRGVGEGGAAFRGHLSGRGPRTRSIPPGRTGPGEICNELFPEGRWGAWLRLFLLHKASQKGSGPAGSGAPLPSPCRRGLRGASLRVGAPPPPGPAGGTRRRGSRLRRPLPSAAPGPVASRLSQDVGQARG